jgi:acyl carrier protein
MMEEKKIFERLTQFVYSVRWKYKQILTRETRLHDDLKIDGDDAVDFFIAFEKEFNVDISNFKLREYFNGEGFDPIGISKLFRLIFGRKDSPVSGIKTSINHGHLIKAIKAGKLDEEIINGE